MDDSRDGSADRCCHRGVGEVVCAGWSTGYGVSAGVSRVERCCRVRCSRVSSLASPVVSYRGVRRGMGSWDGGGEVKTD